MTHRDVQSTLWNGIGPRGESQWGRRRRRRSNVHGSPTAQERLCFCLTRGVSNTRALEFESALERDTSMNSRLRDEGWIRVNNRESKWGDHHLSRSRRHSSTRGCHRDAWGIRRRSCYGMELCLRIENILKGSRKWFTRDKSRSVTCSSEVGKRSLCRLVWEVRWMKSRAHGIQCGTADSSGSSSVGSSHTMAGRKIWWMQNTRSLVRSIITWAIQCQWRGSQQYYMLVKMFSVQALETVRSSPEGVNAEVWRKQARNTNLALVSDMTWYFDLCWKDDLVNMMSGTWVVRSTRSERRGCHRVSSEVFSPTMIQLRTWTRNSVDLWDVFKSRARHLQEAEVQRSHQWDNQEWSRERDVTQRQVLQVIVRAQGAARRDCRFQAEHVEHGKIRTQCKGCSACDRQSGKTRRWRKDDRPSQCGSCFVVVALVVAFVVVAFWPYVVSCSRSSCTPRRSSCSLLSSSLSPLRISIQLPATIWHPSDIPRSTKQCLHNFAFIRTLIWCSHI